jgi:hypothetical protein
VIFAMAAEYAGPVLNPAAGNFALDAADWILM